MRCHWVLPILCIVEVLLAGCADRRDTADRLADSAGLRSQELMTSTFRIRAYTRVLAPEAPLIIYIEGDGLAWVSRSEPSMDPTPRSPVGLLLASLDPSPNVIYLARPCQYVRNDPACRQAYWTDRRFSEEVVQSMNEAANALTAGRSGGGVHLVGYSGGAAIAVLIASRRRDVISLRTVAGNLDPEAVSRLHGVSQLAGSLNPKDVASTLAGLPQRHFVGGRGTQLLGSDGANAMRRLGNNQGGIPWRGLGRPLADRGSEFAVLW